MLRLLVTFFWTVRVREDVSLEHLKLGKDHGIAQKMLSRIEVSKAGLPR